LRRRETGTAQPGEGERDADSTWRQQARRSRRNLAQHVGQSHLLDAHSETVGGDDQRDDMRVSEARSFKE